MEKEFIPYEQALDLKELRFNEPCVAIFCTNKELNIDDGFYKQEEYHKNTVLAPTFSQAFRWFREKYDVYHFVTREVGINTSDIFFVASYYKGKKGNSPKDTCISSRTYKEAELECLKKLIEIVKNK